MNEQTLQPTTNPNAQQITITVAPQNQPEQSTGTESTPTTQKQELSADNTVEQNNNANDLIPNTPYYSDPLFYEVANYFGLKQEDYDSAKNKLSDIVEYVIRELNSNKIDEVIPRIREIEDSIMSSGWDERRYANFHKYVRLADKKATLGKMLKAYEKNPAKKDNA